jgi:DNA-binding response OmpR family regulator
VEPLAVDYIPKESGPQAILDAINVVSRQVGEFVNRRTPSDLRIDLDRKLVWYKGELVKLSRYQYAFLAHLHGKSGAVCSPEELVKVIYGEDVPAEKASLDRRLERLAERLRDKIEDDPSQPQHLIKVYGRGFRLVTDH